MRFVFDALLGGILSAAVGVACAQSPTPPRAPASAPVPMTAASRANPPRNPAITAAENAKEPGGQRPEERVIPQISVPLVRKGSPVSAAATASAPTGSIPGAVNDSAARCLAAGTAGQKAACERAAATSPVKPVR
jgi:hypothetical protein